MRIIDSNKKAVLNLESVKTGQLFKIDGHYYIKGHLDTKYGMFVCWSLIQNDFDKFSHSALIDEVYPNAFIDTGK